MDGYGMDSQQYTQGTAEAIGATIQLQNAMAGLTQGSAQAHRALDSFARLAGVVGLAHFTSAAAAAEQQMGRMRGQAVMAGQSFSGLTKASDALARQFPIGTAGARALTSQIQQLGVAADKHGNNVRQLASTFLKLSSVTGESAAAITSGLGNMARAFGDQRLDPRHMQSLANTVGVLASKMGGSATGIAQFAQNIAPFARQLGIGEKATLGIAASFSRLGDDGTLAANAMNKVLSDVTKAVRDGGPELAKYAGLLNMTVQQFTQMQRANPTQSIQRIFGALGQPGVGGQRALESLGFTDSVRLQGTILRLNQSGTLNQSIAAAMGADPNALNKGAATAMKGFNDSLGRLNGAADQLAEKLGQPTLGPLTQFANLLNTVVGGLSKLVGSGFMQTLIGGGLAASGIAAVASGGARGLLGVGMLRRLAGSRIVGGARVGRMIERAGLSELETAEALPALGTMLSDQQAGLSGRALRRNQAQLRLVERAAQGLTEDVPLGQAGTAALGLGRGVFARPGLGPVEGGGFGMMGRLRATAGWAALMGAQSKDFVTGLAGNPEVTDAANTGLLRRTRAEMGKFFKSVDEGGQTFRQTRENIVKDWKQTNETLKAGGFSGAASTLAQAEARRVGTLGSIGGGLIRGLASPLGIGLGLTAATAIGSNIYSGVQARAAYRKDQLAELGTDTITGTADKYQSALGRATSSSLTLASAFESSARKIRDATPTDYSAGGISGAKNVTQQDVIAANDAKSKRVQYYLGAGRGEGGIATAAAQVSAVASQFPKGMDAANIQQVKTDLLKSGFKADQVQQILNQANTGPQRLSTADALKVVQGIVGRVDTKRGQSVNLLDPTSYGSGLGTGNLGRGSQNALNSLMLSIGAVVAAQPNDRAKAQVYSQYVNAIMGSLANQNEHGNANQQIYQTLTQYAPAGVKVPKFADLYTKPITVNPNASTQTDQSGPYYQISKNLQAGGGLSLRGQSALLGMFDASRKGILGDVSAIPVESTDVVGARANQVYAQLTRGRKGLTPEQVAQLALRLSATTDDQGTLAVLTALQQRGTAQAQFGARSQGILAGQQMRMNLLQAFTPNQFNPGAQQTGAQGFLGTVDAYKQQAQAVLAQQVNFQVQSSRSWRDYYIGLKQQAEDWSTNVSRTWRNFNRDIQRAAQDGAKNMFDPYRRMAVEQIWDPKSLRSNMSEQITAMKKQVSNLAKARRMGFTNATISMLGLNDPMHAQQLEELVNSSSGADVAGMNADTRQRTALAGQLYTDPANTQLQRARADINQSLKDQAADIEKGQKRSREALARGLKDTANDIRRSMQQVTDDTKTLQDKLNAYLKNGTVNAKGLMVSTLQDTHTQLQKLGALTGTDLAQIYQQVLAIATTGAQGGTMQLQVDPKTGKMTLTLNGKKVANTVKPPTSTGPTTMSATTMSSISPIGPAHAGGGLFINGARQITAGEAGPEALIPLQGQGGHDIMAKINRYMGNDLKHSKVSGYRTYVHVEHNTYDHRVIVEKAEIKANSAREVMLELHEMQRRSNLTSTATRKKSA